MARVVFIGDDFTGASDSLATYARSGWRTRLALNPQGATEGLDAVGFATDLRSLTPGRALAEIARLWPRVESEAPRVLHFKVCSTFDSSPGIGSIGAVAAELVARFRPDVLAVLGGQPGLGRYCVFGNLHARGPDGAVHRIDRHPVMCRHPVTPMTEADLRRHLALQGLDDLSLVAFPALDDPDATAAALQRGPVLFDVSSQRDQVRIAEALRAAGGRQLLIGASSVAEILVQGAANGTEDGVVDGAVDGAARSGGLPTAPPPASRNLLVFAGSRSANTRTQVETASSFARVRLSPDVLRSDRLIDATAELLRSGTPVLVHLCPDLDYGQSPDALADASSSFVTAVLGQVEVGYLGLAGGDTSSRICAGLGFASLAFERGLGAGICVCVAAHADPGRDRMRVMLKGGQMGGPDLFDLFAAQSEQGR